VALVEAPNTATPRQKEGIEHARSLTIAILSTAILIVATAGTAAACANAAPGTGLVGALNMLGDPTMLTVPMVHDAPQGNAGMFHAVAVSGCP
jgi:hypothetical protein